MAIAVVVVGVAWKLYLVGDAELRRVAPPPGQAPLAQLTVIARQLNVRAGPGTGYAVRFTVMFGKRVTPLEYSVQGWVRVRLDNGLEGWANREFLASD